MLFIHNKKPHIQVEDITKEKFDDITVYKRLCECRDLEIEHYWHRIVFMTAFMLVTYAGYGGLVKEYLFSGAQKLSSQYFHLIAIGLTFIGIVVSSLWIMISKGSKAWYEQYEKLIVVFCEKLNTPNEYLLSGQYDKIKNCNIEMNNAFWSTSAGSYSVSKVGIFIGQFSLLIWILLLGIHFCLFANNVIKPQIINLCQTIIIILLGFIILLGLAFIIFWFIFQPRLKSSFFNK